MRLVVDQANALAIAMLPQRCRELETRVTGADDQDCSLRHPQTGTMRSGKLSRLRHVLFGRLLCRN
jgi:hypothetical protein